MAPMVFICFSWPHIGNLYNKNMYTELYSNIHVVGYKGIFSKDFPKDFVKSEMMKSQGRSSGWVVNSHFLEIMYQFSYFSG